MSETNASNNQSDFGFAKIQTQTNTFFNGLLIGGDKYTYCLKNNTHGKGTMVYKHGIYTITGMREEPKTGALFGQDTLLNQLRIHKIQVVIYTTKEILYNRNVLSFDDFTITLDGNIRIFKQLILGISFDVNFLNQIEG
jgi:sRNA-binding regulator protein Hfq